MIVTTLLLACVVLAGVVVALAIELRGLRVRLTALEALSATSPGFETGASAPSSTSDTAQLPPSTSDEKEFVITRLGQEPDEPAPTMEAKLFADVMLRESVVKAASWAHGVRLGLSPANRNRIWFEMRREVKRARKERKAEEREAIRQWRARKRAAVRMQAQEESAA